MMRSRVVSWQGGSDSMGTGPGIGETESKGRGLDANPGQSEQHKQARRDLFLGLGAFLAFVLVSLGVLIISTPSHKVGRQSELAGGPSGEGPIEIALVHTNDTWGYLEPCG
jgi:hypothetical protein